MKFDKNKLLTTISAVALVLAVGACSSNGDDGGITAERDMALEDLKAAAAARDAALARVTELEGQLETANGMVTDLQGQLDTANANLGTANDMVMSIQGMLDTANADVTRLEGELKTATDRIAEIEKMRAEDMANDIAKAASEKAAEVLKALEMLSGTLPTITVSASSGGTFAAEAASYTESSTTADAISGFRGKILTKDGSEAHVYSNIEDAVATAIDGIYSASSGLGKPKAYDVTDDGADDSILWTAVKRADTVVTETGVADDQVSSFAGSVRGLPGVFSCAGTGYTAPTRNTNGSVNTAADAGTWTFAPTNPNGTIDVADDDGYVHFGWWLNMKGDDVDDGFDVQTFATATGYGEFAEVRGDSADVTGSATYTGGAAGKWAIASTTEDTTEGGHFTATATLGVDFDANTAAANVAANKDGVTVSGSVTDFMTGATSRPSWKVTLTYDGNDGEDGVQPSLMLNPMIAGTSKWTTGGAVDGTGMWEAMFHGSEKDTGHPMAVDGTFNADIAGGSVGRIQGAFGATK